MALRLTGIMAPRTASADDVLGKYELGPVLGRGQFGVVQRAQVKATEEFVAVKIIEKGCMEAEKLQSEIDCQSLLDHQNILKLVEAIDLDDCVVIVMELAGGGDLFDYIMRHGRVSEEDARPLFRQLLDGVSHCHSQSVAHRDLKPENILLSEDGKVKLADFGLSVKFKPEELLTDSVGSPNYAAPELLIRGSKYDGRKVDAWACGVVLFAMLAGRLPFDRESIPDLFKDIKLGNYKIPGFFSTETVDLVKQLLTVNPDSRLSVEGALGHPWFAKTNAASAAAAAAPASVTEAAGADAAIVEAERLMDPSATLPLLLLEEEEEDGSDAAPSPTAAPPPARLAPLPPVASVIVLLGSGCHSARGPHRKRASAMCRRRNFSALEHRVQHCLGANPSQQRSAIAAS